MIVDVRDAMCRQHTWVSLTAAQGLPDAIPFNNGAAKRMTAIQIVEAQRLIVQLKSKRE